MNLFCVLGGNKALLPVFVYQTQTTAASSPKQGSPRTPEEALLVPLEGSLVDVRKLKQQNEKYEAERAILEANLNALGNNMSELYCELN